MKKYIFNLMFIFLLCLFFVNAVSNEEWKSTISSCTNGTQGTLLDPAFDCTNIYDNKTDEFLKQKANIIYNDEVILTLNESRYLRLESTNNNFFYSRGGGGDVPNDQYVVRDISIYFCLNLDCTKVLERKDFNLDYVGCSSSHGKKLFSSYNSTSMITTNNIKIVVNSSNYSNCYGDFKYGIIELNLSFDIFSTFDNDLPTINVINQTSIICFEKEQNSANFEFELNVTDKENDTIYYATKLFNYERKTEVYFEDFVTTQGGDCEPDYSFFSRPVLVSNFSHAISKNDAFFSVLGLERNIHWIASVRDPDSKCVGRFIIWSDINKFVLKTPNSYNFDTEVQIITEFRNNDTYISLSPINSEQELILNVTLNLTDTGNLKIYIDGVEEFSFSHITTEFIYFNYHINISQNVLTLNISTTTNPNNLINRSLILNNFNGFLFGQIDTYEPLLNFGDDGKFNINQIKVFGINYDTKLDWSITKPNLQIVTELGNKYIFDIYVTDSIHLNREYNNLTLYFQVLDCENLVSTVNLIGSKEDEVPYTPKINNDFIKGLFILFRTPRRLFDALNLTTSLFMVVNISIVWGLINKYNLLINGKFNKKGEMIFPPLLRKEILPSLFGHAFVRIFILYVVFLLMEETIFIIFSVFGLLYIGHEILNMLGVSSNVDSVEKTIFFSTAGFNILSFIYFQFVSIATGVTFFRPSIPTEITNSLSGVLALILNIVVHIWNLLFFSIEGLPNFLNIILFSLRVISIFSFLVVLRNLINPLSRA